MGGGPYPGATEVAHGVVANFLFIYVLHVSVTTKNREATTKKQVAVKNSTAVAAPSIDLSLVAQDAGQGLSEVNMDTIQIPFLKILSSVNLALKLKIQWKELAAKKI